jgi:hypothetical protein
VATETTDVAAKATHVTAEATTHMTSTAAHMAASAASATSATSAATAASGLGVGRKQAAGQQSARQDRHHHSLLHNIILSVELYLRSVDSAAVS